MIVSPYDSACFTALEHKSSNGGMIAGIVIGIVVVLAIIGGVIVFMIRRRRVTYTSV